MTEKKTNIIVIDDDETVAEFSASVANVMGFSAIFSSRPQDFGSYYRNDIDIFIIDIFMPEVDGIELLRFLSENKSKASVIFMICKDKSILRAAETLAVFLGINVLGSLHKPFRASELENILKEYKVPEVISPVLVSCVPTMDDLAQALEKQQFHIVYQPQVRISDSCLVGVEALIRWNHPVKGSIPPDFFIPLAEKHGLIKDITWYVAHTVLKQAGKWHAQGRDLRVSINMSPKMFNDLDLPEKLASIAENAGANISKITIEVTETAITTDVAYYIDVLTRLRMKGFGLSIDDFGTGYSSMVQLIHVSFNELKIDRTFIYGLLSDDESRAITEASSSLAHKLGMYVVAEGVENEETWNLLRDMGCEEVQGYWIAKPMRPEELFFWEENWSNRALLHGYSLAQSFDVQGGQRPPAFPVQLPVHQR